MIIKNVLKLVCPKLNSQVVENLSTSFGKYFPEYEINLSQRVAAFLSQAIYETGYFKWFTELGDEKYFSKYENRSDLGNIHSGDGATYKGRGIFQLTGRANYEKFGKLLNLSLVDNPKLASEPDIAVHIACEFWKVHKLNALADSEDVKAITRKINGGLNGYEERLKIYQKVKPMVA